MKVLLDTHTHILLYWFGKDSRLSKRQGRTIQQASPEHPLLIANISLWEIANLYSLGRIALNLPLREWLEAAARLPHPWFNAWVSFRLLLRGLLAYLPPFLGIQQIGSLLRPLKS